MADSTRTMLLNPDIVRSIRNEKISDWTTRPRSLDRVSDSEEDRPTEGSAWNTRPFWVAERRYREPQNREDQVGRVGGIPKSEKAVRGDPEALRVLRGCAVARLRSCGCAVAYMTSYICFSNTLWL